jgi:ABC-type dipeptide/oligopeptide/nickel transport system permease subunit
MAIFLPVIFYSLIAAVYERTNQSLMESLQFYMQLPAVPLLLIGLYILGFGIFLYFFARWYIRLLYGKYLDKLKDLLTELDTLE